MAEKQSFFNRIIARVGGKAISDMVDVKVKEELAKADGSDIVRFSPGSVSPQGGSVEKPLALGVDFKTLRALADNYPIARACIEFRKSQITHLDWNVSPKEITDETVTDKKNVKNANELKEFFKHPTGKKDISFTDWLKQVMEDLLVIDAVALYRRVNRGRNVIGYLPVDGSTISLRVEQDGTTPEPPEIAYIQKIDGKVKAQLTTDEMIYAKMTPRTHSVYGFAALESLIVTVTTALKVQAHSLAYLTEGNIPEGFVTLPRDIASSRDQLKEWQDAWDAMLAGDPRFQRKLKFLPEGMSYEPAKDAKDMEFERFEKWLLQNTCSVFGIHPSAIGFNFDVNRATAEITWEAGRERGLFPTAQFIKEIMDGIIQDDMGHPELQFVWTNINPTNRQEEAKVVKDLISTGLMSIDEWRLGEGLKPTGIKDPFIVTPVGPIFLKDLKAQSESGQQPVAPYKPTTGPGSGGDDRKLKIPSQGKMAKQNFDDYVAELLKWKKVATNDVKNGKPIREFKTDIIDKRTYFLIKTGLERAKTKSDVLTVFKPFQGKDNFISNSLLNLSDGIDNIIKDREVEEASDESA